MVCQILSTHLQESARIVVVDLSVGIHSSQLIFNRYGDVQLTVSSRLQYQVRIFGSRGDAIHSCISNLQSHSRSLDIVTRSDSPKTPVCRPLHLGVTLKWTASHVTRKPTPLFFAA